MKKFLTMLLAVLLCTTAMCATDVFANSTTSVDATKSDNKTVQESIQDIKSTAINSNNGAYSDEEVYLTAQLVWHEAHNQSYNGKVAIAEVVLNRVNSGLFPNTVSAVINQSGQFLNSRRLKNINPTEQELRIAYNVLNGSLRVFDNSDVLYFRNPKVTSGIAASVDKDWGSLDYVSYIGDHAFYSQEEKTVTVADNTTVEENNKTSIFDKLPSALSLGNIINKVKQVAESKHVDKNVAVTEQPSQNTDKEKDLEKDAIEVEVVTTEQTAEVSEESQDTGENFDETPQEEVEILMPSVSEVAVKLIESNENLTVEQAMLQAEYLIAQTKNAQALALGLDNSNNVVAADKAMELNAKIENGETGKEDLKVEIKEDIKVENKENNENKKEDIKVTKDSDSNEADSDELDNNDADSNDEDADSIELEASEEQKLIAYMNALALEKAKAAQDEDDIEDEEIDENDPVARAQRQARIDAKRQLKEMEKLEAENAKANEAATKLAKQNVNEAVQRVDILMKLGQTKTNTQ